MTAHYVSPPGAVLELRRADGRMLRARQVERGVWLESLDGMQVRASIAVRADELDRLIEGLKQARLYLLGVPDARAEAAKIQAAAGLGTAKKRRGRR